MAGGRPYEPTQDPETTQRQIVGFQSEANTAILDAASQSGKTRYVINLFIEGEEPEYVDVDEPAETPWQTNSDTDPAGGAAVIESWDSEKADALLESAIATGPEKPAIPMARDFITDHLQGRTVKTVKGDCIITADSRGELALAADRYGKIKMRCIPRVPEILINGKAESLEPLNKVRKDRITGFYPFTHAVTFKDGVKADVVLKVGVRDAGLPLVYTLDAKSVILDSAQNESDPIVRYSADNVSAHSVSGIASEAPVSPSTSSLENSGAVCLGYGRAFNTILDDSSQEVNLILDSADDDDDDDGINIKILHVWDKDGNELDPETLEPLNPATGPTPSQSGQSAAVQESPEPSGQTNAETPAQPSLKAMSVPELQAEYARVKARMNAQDRRMRFQNEGGEGYSGDESQFVSRLVEIDDLIFRRQWEGVWQERRDAWNAAVRAMGGGKATIARVKEIEKKVGFTFNDMKRAKAMFGEPPVDNKLPADTGIAPENEPLSGAEDNKADPQKESDRALFQSVIDNTVADILAPGLAGSLRAAYNRTNLRSLVQDGQIFSVDFIKRTDGSLRRMICRFGVKKYLKGGYRSIPVEAVQSLTVHGQTFNFAGV